MSGLEKGAAELEKALFVLLAEMAEAKADIVAALWGTVGYICVRLRPLARNG
mgnify:CR=1 FL=1